MSQATIGLIIGGLVPAVFFGLSTVFQKLATQVGISPGAFMVSAALGVASIGCVGIFMMADRSTTLRGCMHAMGFGFLWGAGSFCIAYALSNYAVPMSKIVPLYNMNTLVAVILCLIIFSEWRDVQTIKLLAGTACIVVGGILVSQS